MASYGALEPSTINNKSVKALYSVGGGTTQMYTTETLGIKSVKITRLDTNDGAFQHLLSRNLINEYRSIIPKYN